MDQLNVTVDECAHILGLGITKTKRLVQTGDILSIRIGRRRLVPLTAISEYQRKLEDEARADHDGHLEQQQRINAFTRKRRPA